MPADGDVVATSWPSLWPARHVDDIPTWPVTWTVSPSPVLPHHAYLAGYYSSDGPLSINPYKFGTDEHHRWTDGWNTARMTNMRSADFYRRNQQRRLEAPQRPQIDSDVQELLDDNVHALRQDIWGTGQ